MFAVQRSHLSSGDLHLPSGHQVLSQPLKHITDEILMFGHLGLDVEYYL